MHQVYFKGHKSLEKLKEKLPLNKNFLLVSGKNSYLKTGGEAFFKSFENIILFQDFTSNPKIEDVEKGIEIFLENNCHGVICLGGGTAMDIGKSIALLHTIAKEDRIEAVKGNINLPKKSIPVFCIPTSVGTGSESTHFSVVYINGKKYSLAEKNSIPDVVTLDPSLCQSLPRYELLSSVMDCVSQGIESLWSVNSNGLSKDFAEKGLRLVIKVLNNNQSLENLSLSELELLQEAANFCGKAINISKTTGAHALSYKLAEILKIGHGHSVWLALPGFIKHNFNGSGEIFIPGGVKALNEIESILLKLFSCKDVKDLSNYFNKLMDHWDIKRLFSKEEDVFLSDESIQMIADSINIERLKNNPRLIEKSDLLQMLNELVKGNNP